MPFPDSDTSLDLPGFPGGHPGSAAELLSDCRSTAGRWPAAAAAPGAAPTASGAGPAAIRGTSVPAASAHAVAGMSEYGS